MGGDSTLDQVPGEGGAAQLPTVLSEQPGTRIGHYKLLEQIGEGGFGIVWMAEQEEPVRRRVALKIIKLGMDTREVVARFEAERQALAMMEHANIASVFDGGATATGRPYFVMELVKGVPITTYCDVNRLTTKERLELFLEVCHAVQHAHQKGVIHRDLKPSNILVTVKDDRAVPKVIDFGIAKATQAALTEKTLFTRLNQWIGTPAYMSPEQAGLGSLDVDTRSDIYSLGVLLYELLTGRPPFDPEKLLTAGYDAVMRVIREDEPPKPSTRLSTLTEEEMNAVAAKRGAEPAKLNRLLRGDLDWIVMKALEKDRRRRYETANGLADDLLHHLNDEPVDAGAPSPLYLLHKLVRRHRVAVVATTTVITALIAAAAVSIWQAVVATNERKKAGIAEGIAIQEQNRAEQLAKERQRQLTNASWTSYNHADQLLRGEGNPEGKEVQWWAMNRMLREAVSRLARAVIFDPHNVEARQRFGWVVLTQRGGLCSLPVAEYSVENAGSSWLSEDGSRLVTLNDGVIRSFEAVTGRLLSESRLENTADLSISTLSPDGRLLTGIDKSHRGPVWEVASGRKLLELPHDDVVNHVRFSADGSRIITGADHTVRVWDSGSGRQLARLAHDTKVVEAVFNRQGTQIFTADEKATGRVFDASNGALLTVFGAAFNENAAVRLVDVGSVDIWNMDAGHDARDHAVIHQAWPSSTLHAEFSGDGSHLITTCNGEGKVWDTASGRLIFTTPSEICVEQACLTADGKSICGWLLAVSNARSFAIRVPAQKGAMQESLDHAEFTIGTNPGDFQLSPDGRWGIISGDNGESVVIPVPTVVEERAVRGRGMVMFPFDATLHHRVAVGKARYSSDGRHIIIVSTTTVEGNRPLGRQLSVWNAPPFSPGFLGFERTENMDLKNPVFDPSGACLAIINHSFSPPFARKDDVKILDTLRGSLLLTLPHSSRIKSLRFSADGSRVLTYSYSNEPDPWAPAGHSLMGTAHVWDAHTGQLRHEIVHRFKLAESACEPPAFSADGDSVAFVDIDESQTVISIHNTTSGKPLGMVKTSTGKLVWWNLLDGGRVLAACEDGRVLAWDAGTLGERLLYRHRSKLVSAVMSPDGSRLALHAAEKPDVIVDLRTGMRLLDLPVDFGKPLAWSLNASTLVTYASNWETSGYGVRFWDVSANRPLLSISDFDPAGVPPSKRELGSLAYDPAGEWLCAGESSDYTLWNARTGRMQFDLSGDSYPAFSSDGRLFTCGGRLYSTIPVRQLGQISGDAVPASDFELMARFLTARKLTDEGEVRPLDYDEWRAAGDELRARATQPGPLREWAQWLTTSGPDALVWPGGPPMPKDVKE
jgi:serine/threonine protein kinase/WD40 repeat protein